MRENLLKNLTIFIEDIDDFLKDNDLKMTIRILQKENAELKLQNMQLKLDLLTNKTR